MGKSLNYPYDTVFNACIKAIEDCGFKIQSQYKKSGKITAHTKFSIWSWQEEITITLKNIAGNKVNLDFQSECTAQFIGWGKNERNQKKILNKLNDILNK